MVNNIIPGLTRSNPITEKRWQFYDSEDQKYPVSSIALKRLGSPGDIAHPTLVSVSEQATWSTGPGLTLDSGRL